MTIHMVKLCVGADSVEDVIEWQQRLMKSVSHPFHLTRMHPKRAEELMHGGSISWVMKRAIRVRQQIIDIQSEDDDDGRKICRLIFDPELVRTYAQPKRPFQGWRYLQPESAPADIGSGNKAVDIPVDLDEALKKAGVW